jgi:hypothetical protein
MELSKRDGDLESPVIKLDKKEPKHVLYTADTSTDDREVIVRQCNIVFVHLLELNL